MLDLVFKLILVMHIIGSFWYFVCKTDRIWIPPLDFVYAAQYPKIYRSWSEDYTDSYRYLVNLYNAVLFLGGNEMGPRTNTEIFVCTLILMVLAIFNAALFGEMAVLTEQTGRKQQDF